MRNKYFILAIFLLIAGSVFTGCENNREKVEDAKDKVSDAKQDLQDAQAKYEMEWNQFKSDAELKINANEKKISDFRTDMKTASGKFRAKYENDIAVLNKKISL
jgi:outer membrane murein-binding lipoprotein Lpp